MSEASSKKPTKENAWLEEPTRFPEILYVILNDPKHTNVIAWLPDGLSWIIHHREKLINEVFGQYSKVSYFKSFQRQLTGWGFSRRDNKIKDVYFHPMFMRGRYDCIPFMKRLLSNANTGDSNEYRATTDICFHGYPDECLNGDKEWNGMKITRTSIPNTISLYSDWSHHTVHCNKRQRQDFQYANGTLPIDSKGSCSDMNSDLSEYIDVFCPDENDDSKSSNCYEPSGKIIKMTRKEYKQYSYENSRNFTMTTDK